MPHPYVPTFALWHFCADYVSQHISLRTDSTPSFRWHPREAFAARKRRIGVRLHELIPSAHVFLFELLEKAPS